MNSNNDNENVNENGIEDNQSQAGLLSQNNYSQHSQPHYTDIQQCTDYALQWISLTVSLAKKSKVNDQHNHLLNNISGAINKCSFTAIMGPSGAGKTTLLNFLSGRIESSGLQFSGDLYLNNRQVKNISQCEFKDRIAYLLQNDILLKTTTPYEALEFAASIKLKMNASERKQEVDKYINKLGLQYCKDTRVGDFEHKELSGGERKRTCIGVELIGKPNIIFLDEPTTGLDSTTALEIIQILKSLVVEEKLTIVLTIHQPSSEIFSLFDNLLLLAKGDIIYQGEIQNVSSYFKQINFECPNNMNIADHILKLLNQESLMINKLKNNDQSEPVQMFKKQMILLNECYSKSDTKRQFQIKSTVQGQNISQGNNEVSDISCTQQFIVLIQRSILNQLRNRMDLPFKILQTLFNVAMLLLVYSDLGSYSEGVQNRNGALFFLCTANSLCSIQGALYTFSVERPLFIKEVLNKTYSVHAYFLAKVLSEFIFQLIFPALTVMIPYYIIGLNPDIYQFGILVLIQILTYWYGVSFGLLITAILPDLQKALALVPVLLMPQMIVGGYFVNSDKIPVIFIPLQYISMFKYSFEASNEYGDVDYICQPPMPMFPYEIPCNPIQMLSITSTIQDNLIILFFLGLAVRIFAYMALYILTKPASIKVINTRSVNSVSN